MYQNMKYVNVILYISKCYLTYLNAIIYIYNKLYFSM